MKRKISKLTLNLDIPVTAEEASTCLDILFGGVDCHFDEDGMQRFRPEALKAVRKASANSINKFGLEFVKEVGEK